MGKKTKTTVTETVEEPAEEKKQEEKKADPVEKKDEEEPVVMPKKEEKKDEKAADADKGKADESKGKKKDAEPPAPSGDDDDDDISFIKQTLAKQMIDSLDVDTLKKFVVECEGKSLKFKAAWIEKNKPAAVPDPSKSLAKGAPGGRPLTPYDPGYKHVFVDNRPKH